MFYDKCAVVPKVLLESVPELRAPLTGTEGVRGELMAYPFAGGGLLLCAVSGALRDGLYELRLEGGDLPTLPALLACGGMAYGLTLLPMTMEQLYGVRAVFGPELAKGTFAFN